LFSQPADGTGSAVKIAFDQDGLDQAVVSPDGKSVLARSAEDIVIASIDGRTVRKLIDSPFRDRNPDVSPDGRWLAYQSDESGVPEVYVRPFPETGKGKWQVSEQGGSRPVWARSGTELFYLGADGTVMSVSYNVAANAFVPSTPRAVVRLPQAPGAHRGFDVSADGRRFLTIGGQTSTERAEINVVLNWLEELKKRVP
jgi:Tol biopolymer transport system component